MFGLYLKQYKKGCFELQENDIYIYKHRHYGHQIILARNIIFGGPLSQVIWLSAWLRVLTCSSACGGPPARSPRPARTGPSSSPNMK